MERGFKIQGVLVSVSGVGILIQGPSGSGKTFAALGLMSKGHRLVSDDLVELYLDGDGNLMGKSVEEHVRMELRGVGVFRAGALFDDATVSCSPVNLVVDLDTYDPARDAGRTEPETGVIDLMGCERVKVRLPLVRGSDTALLIELLARLFRQGGMVTP